MKRVKVRMGRVRRGKSSSLQDVIPPGGTIRVSFDVTPEHFFQMLQTHDGPVKVRARTRTMLELNEVLQIVPVSKSTLLRMLSEGRFPPAHYISPNRRVWYEDDILHWQATLNGTVSSRKRSKPKRAKRKARKVAPKKKRAQKR
jgi:prophage regulatory protein